MIDNNKGFTLIELIVVIAIIGIILILALPQVNNIQDANKNRKYEVYMESIRAASKLYIDSHARDLFGNNKSGCITVKYSDLKQSNLIKDFGDANISCGNDSETDSETYVEVRKVLSEYKYKVNIVCRNKESNKVVWKTQEIPEGSEACNIEPDTTGPEIKAEPENTNNKWYNSRDLNIKIQVSDVSGLKENISIIYNWYNKTTGTQYSDNSKNYKNKRGIEKVSFIIPGNKRPQGAGGKYKLTITPDTKKGHEVQDALGNVRVLPEVEEEYWIDNEAPKFNNTTVSSADTNYHSKNIIFTMDATDNFTPKSDLKVYISNTGYEKGGQWESYSDQISWSLDGSYDGTSRTIYMSIKDLAGNTAKKKFTYTIYKECSATDKTSTVGKCSGVCGTGTAVRTDSVKDKYTKASCPGDNKTTTESCNTGIDCCSQTVYKPGSSWTNSGACSTTCGTGQQLQTIPTVSKYDNNISCGTATRYEQCVANSGCCNPKGWWYDPVLQCRRYEGCNNGVAYPHGGWFNFINEYGYYYYFHDNGCLATSGSYPCGEGAGSKMIGLFRGGIKNDDKCAVDTQGRWVIYSAFPNNYIFNRNLSINGQIRYKEEIAVSADVFEMEHLRDYQNGKYYWMLPVIKQGNYGSHLDGYIDPDCFSLSRSGPLIVVNNSKCIAE